MIIPPLIKIRLSRELNPLLVVFNTKTQNYSERRKKVVIARSEATCLHAEVPAFAGALRAGRRYGTQAWQSLEVAPLRSQ